MNQKGFILPTGLALYGIIGAAVGVLGLTGAVWLQTSRLETRTVELETRTVELKAKTDEHDKFVADVKLIGEAQEKIAKATDDRYKKLVKEKDDELFVARTQFASVAKRLRDPVSGSGRSVLPPAPANTSRPDLACYARADLDAALRSFTGGAGEIVIEGQSNTIDLNSAKEWASDLRGSKPP